MLFWHMNSWPLKMTRCLHGASRFQEGASLAKTWLTICLEPSAHVTKGPRVSWIVTNSFLLLLAWHFVTRSVALVTTGLKTEAHLICNYSNFKKDAKELNDGFLCRVKLAQAELKSVFLWGLLSPLIQLLHKVVGGLTKNHSKARKRTKTSCNSFRFSIRFSRFHTVFCRLRRKSLNIRPTNLAFSSILAMASNLLCRNSCGKTESPQWAHCAIFLCLPPLPILVLCHRFSEYCASFAIILCPLSNRVLWRPTLGI